MDWEVSAEGQCPHTGDAKFTPVFFAVCCVNVFCRCIPTTALPSMLLERFVASYYISDYEAKSRVWVAGAAIVLSCAVSLFYTSVLMFGILGVDKAVIYAVGMCVVASITFITLYRRERRRLDEFIIGTRTDRYLSTRYQIIENFRVLKASSWIFYQESKIG
ncbi:hypothetical protein COOONC_11271 [Cooperia oncophora]